MKIRICVGLLPVLFLFFNFGCSKIERFNYLDPIDNSGPIGDDNYYVATWGNDENPGTFEEPFATWQKAVTISVPGDTTYFRGGVWQPKTHIGTSAAIGILIRPLSSTNLGVSGTKQNPICYFAYPGETPILDCRDVPVTTANYNNGISLEFAEYIQFKGLTVRNVRQDNPLGYSTGFSSVGCANLIIENMTVHDVAGRGFVITSGAWNDFDGPNAPFESDITLIINCDAFNLCDSLSSNAGNAADGFRSTNYVGNYWRFEGCRAWNYSDDGFDPSGAGFMEFSSCWAMATDKYAMYEIEANGFKMTGLGSDWGLPAEFYDQSLTRNNHLRLIRNCIAAYCGGSAYLNNVQAELQNNAVYYNNIAYRCGSGFFDAQSSDTLIRTGIYRNNISIYSTSIYIAGIYRPSIYRESHNNWDATMLPFPNGWPGAVYTDTVTVTDDDFISVIPGGLIRSRHHDGSLPEINFLKLKENSDLKGAGVNVGMSIKPDMGVDWAYVNGR